VAEAPAVDASPLIFLAHARLADLLQLAAPELVVPEPVAAEIQRRGDDDVTARALRDRPWLRVEPPPPIPPSVERWDLGPGESAVLAWCIAHPGAEAIIDDRDGRRCALIHQVPVRGTLGLILLAKKRGRIAAARPILERMRESGMYLSDGTLDQALSLVGE
jgi:predicted nucleic acid-binding protein